MEETQHVNDLVAGFSDWALVVLSYAAADTEFMDGAEELVVALQNHIEQRGLEDKVGFLNLEDFDSDELTWLCNAAVDAIENLSSVLQRAHERFSYLAGIGQRHEHEATPGTEVNA